MHVTKCIYGKKHKTDSLFKYGSAVEIHSDFFFKEASEEPVRGRKLKKLLRRSYGFSGVEETVGESEI